MPELSPSITQLLIVILLRTPLPSTQITVFFCEGRPERDKPLTVMSSPPIITPPVIDPEPVKVKDLFIFAVSS